MHIQNAGGHALVARIFRSKGEILLMKNPAVKMAVYMLLLLAVIWLLGYLMRYNGEVKPFSLG